MAIETTVLESLDVEQISPRDQQNHKLLFTYDESLKALQQREFERHLRPSEASQVLIVALEHSESPYKPLADDMLYSFGEWFSLAMERKDKTTLSATLIHKILS